MEIKIKEIIIYNMKNFFCITFLGLFIFPVFSQQTVEKLLEGYFKNSLEIHNLSAEMDEEIIQAEKTLLQTGLSIKVSTGTVQITAGDETEISLSPNASLQIPQADNLSFSAKSNIEIEDGDADFKNTNFSVSADIISSGMEKRRITLDESNRAVLVAQRNLQNGFVSVESEFYKSIKSLYQTIVNISNAKKDLYEDQLSFNQIKAQGYSTSSTKYRLAEMEVISDQHKVEVYEHELEREAKIFASKCGIEWNFKNVKEFLPKEIPQVQPIKISSFNKEDYLETENANWKSEINERKRQADKDLTLSVNAGYTINNEVHNDEYKNTIDAGTALTWNGTGLTANAGISVPTNSDPLIYTFGLSVDPNEFKLRKLSKKIDDIERSKEKIEINSSKSNYVTSVIRQNTTLHDLEWAKKKDLENLDLYTKLEEDTKTYFDRGLITESEYNSAKVNKENYQVQCLIDDIEMIIYNNDTKLLFTRDSELYKDKENVNGDEKNEDK